ncbi:MAG: hypothetical protein MI923_06435 [Phycisphaerales bacterium]|nr:hypothetical protein [Phycisphaerales bacterium]
MSDVRTFDPASIKFDSTVYPTEADMKLWNSLTAEEKRAVINHSLGQGLASGLTDPETFEKRFSRALERAKPS